MEGNGESASAEHKAYGSTEMDTKPDLKELLKEDPLLALAPSFDEATQEEALCQVEIPPPGEHPHDHFSQRGNWLRAMVLGANDGLVSTGALMLGVGGGSNDKHALILAGVSGLVAGAFSMAVGEYISVSSQKDSEQADIEKERMEQAKGADAQRRELMELAYIYKERGCSDGLAMQVAVALSRKDVIRAHARDELNIDLDELANPFQAAAASFFAFIGGAIIPIIAGAVSNTQSGRLWAITLAATVGLAFFGAFGAYLGGAHRVKASGRVLIGGWIALAATYGVGLLFGDVSGGSV